MSTPAPTPTDVPARPPCVLCFNASDPSGAGGLSADLLAMASASCHVLPVTTSVWLRDSRHLHGHHALDAEWIDDQARTVLEDVSVAAVKVGFAGSAHAVAAIGAILSDYDELPVVTYLPELAWWTDAEREAYLEACEELLLPQTDVLVGNHHTLARWLLPDWEDDRPPGPRDIARAAAVHGVSYTLVTGAVRDDGIDNHLASPELVLAHVRFERIDATFIGAGDTLSAALTALLAHGSELGEAGAEALRYLDQTLVNGFQPGMGHAVPDRLFWADDDDEPDERDPAEKP
ncbi:bifunctional hydroxymethylpyrimidine kinase/phosphomethylpyrimidine kinase [Tepidimonas taiwanensis]|uniref:Hydroxymethylpyrimidine/phosphomethylpyrimidine kinase n=1 Tax=Tepidimonas taiwanensis TaxID=307486 RepID=A0A554X187_9BURK|nr:bifunctional hydroxymethylpyrimidine kinase/phosphomethylpyrimidine kinase [Tepidimonas taiwanensis]MCX7692921.1 bifunctional hydroxymethylpyrimidine kinase/phosphomethylpyrimidine kinase [Tepidimonas taiwanensis]TSE29609.1 Hydroxymethylpyrimidine/phosphomethylpyrimidine kinase [Tepidimonas taiwanensis]UBQ04814.1 bifunctional hydroxymethylpyrimidine kinase/phosphomethylpyrimidine kinase [Tepidimonas taiwanensis]